MCRPDAERIQHAKQHTACFVLGSNIEAEQLSDAEVIAGYKAQAQAEGGFRFLKDPLFFVSSLFVKKPSRIQGLLMVMTLALLVYSVAQRRLRQELARQNETIPNQINQPTNRPTLRWVFQVLEGIERVRVQVDGQVTRPHHRFECGEDQNPSPLWRAGLPRVSIAFGLRWFNCD